MFENGSNRNSNKSEKLECKNIWNKDKEKREIFVLYNFLELSKKSFHDVLTKRENRTTDYEKRNHIPTIDCMVNQLETACTDYLNYVSSEKQFGHEFYRHINYHGVDIGTCISDNQTLNIEDAKNYFITIFNNISLSSESYVILTKENRRLVNFMWSFIRIAITTPRDHKFFIRHIDNVNLSMIGEGDPPPVYETLSLNNSPATLDDKIKIIKDFFDLLKLDRNKKEMEINYIYDFWNTTKKDNRIINWLQTIENKLSDEHKKEIIKWIWNHISDKYYNQKLPSWAENCQTSLKLNNEETKENIITFFDLMNNEVIKNSIICELKTSASKAKYRITNNSKIHLNIPISEKEKFKFDSLKNKFNLSNEELMIKLINLGHDELKKYGGDREN